MGMRCCGMSIKVNVTGAKNGRIRSALPVLSTFRGGTKVSCHHYDYCENDKRISKVSHNVTRFMHTIHANRPGVIQESVLSLFIFGHASA